MPTTSATSSIIQTLGAGSGIDMAGLAESLAAASFAAKVDRNTARAELVERQISEASELRSSILLLASSVGDRIRSGDLSAQPSIANSSVATVSRGTAAGSGTYSLEVTELAAAQTLASPAFAAATTPVGAGTLTIRFGTIASGTFSEDPGHTAAAITIPSGATLADVAAAINGANAGVRAYVANGTSGATLMLKGQEGAANAFVIEASETPGEEGLAALAWTPAAAPGRLLASAANAAFKLDGLAMSSASNTLNDLVPGLNVVLTGLNPGQPSAIRFSDPTAAVTTFMQDFVAALNELAGALNESADAKSGDLARDPGARALRKMLSELSGTNLMPTAAAGQPARLADLGLATNRDGTFRLDSARLTATLRAAPSAVAAMFTTGIHGVYAGLDRMSRTLTVATNPGSLGGSVKRYSDLKTRLAEEKAELAEAQEKFRQQMLNRFAGTDIRVGASRSTLSFLQNQIDAWNAQRN
jgi:flagellar hook-associated protein 2